MFAFLLLLLMLVLAVVVAVRAWTSTHRENMPDIPAEDMIHVLCIRCNEFRDVRGTAYVAGDKGGYQCHPSC